MIHRHQHVSGSTWNYNVWLSITTCVTQKTGSDVGVGTGRLKCVSCQVELNKDKVIIYFNRARTLSMCWGVQPRLCLSCGLFESCIVLSVVWCVLQQNLQWIVGVFERQSAEFIILLKVNGTCWVHLLERFGNAQLIPVLNFKILGWVLI